MIPCQGLGDDSSMIPARRDKLLSAQSLGHQSGKKVCISVITEGYALGKTCPRNGVHDHIKGCIGISSIFGRISEPINHFVVAIERIGKAVEQEQWGRVGAFAAFVDEM